MHYHLPFNPHNLLAHCTRVSRPSPDQTHAMEAFSNSAPPNTCSHRVSDTDLPRGTHTLWSYIICAPYLDPPGLQGDQEEGLTGRGLAGLWRALTRAVHSKKTDQAGSLWLTGVGLFPSSLSADPLHRWLLTVDCWCWCWPSRTNSLSSRTMRCRTHR